MRNPTYPGGSERPFWRAHGHADGTLAFGVGACRLELHRRWRHEGIFSGSRPEDLSRQHRIGNERDIIHCEEYP